MGTVSVSVCRRSDRNKGHELGRNVREVVRGLVRPNFRILVGTKKKIGTKDVRWSVIYDGYGEDIIKGIEKRET